MKKITSLLLTVILLTSCLPGNRQVPQSPLLPFLERKSGLIAYIGVDWNIYTADQAGQNIIAYTDNASVSEDATQPYRYYVYPAWSPDGASLGFVGISGQGTESMSELYIANVDEETSTKVFTSGTQHPFYLHWSPDNTNLGFLTTTSDGQSMILQSVSNESNAATIIDSGVPYYWSWAPDGKTMIIHTGSAEASTPERLSFLQVDADIIESQLDEPPASFQAPAWSPDGQHILLTRVNEDGEKEIVITNGQGEFEKVLGTFALNTAFAWSSDNNTVAYIEGKEAIGAGALGTMRVMDVETSEELFTDENVFAFFWSPSGEQIAYFVPMLSNAEAQEGQSDSTTQEQQQQLLLQLKVVDVNSGESRELYTFRPTQQFAAILPYFDQYHQSATIWSPDDNNLVLSFLTSDGAPGIAVAAASGQLEPRILAQGYLAFWSPR